MSNCTICKHLERDAIDRAIVSGKSQRQLARIFNVSRDSILRHSRQHVPVTIAKSEDATVLAHADDLVGQISRLEEEATRLQAVAEQSGEVRAAIAALRERTRLTELRAKVAGELKPPQVNILNLNVDEETAKRAMHAYLAKTQQRELAP
jgi:Psq-like protein